MKTYGKYEEEYIVDNYPIFLNNKFFVSHYFYVMNTEITVLTTKMDVTRVTLFVTSNCYFLRSIPSLVGSNII